MWGKGYVVHLVFFVCDIPPPHSPELKPSRRHRRHLFVPETSAHATDRPSPRGAPDPVTPALIPQLEGLMSLFFWLVLTSFHMCLLLLDGVASSESQTGKPHLSFVNKGKHDHLSHILINPISWLLFDYWVRIFSHCHISISWCQGFYFFAFWCRWGIWAALSFSDVPVVLTCRWPGRSWIRWHGQQADCPLPRQPSAFCWQPPTRHWWERAQRFLYEYASSKSNMSAMSCKKSSSGSINMT